MKPRSQWLAGLSVLLVAGLAFTAYQCRGYFTGMLPAPLLGQASPENLEVPEGFVVDVYIRDVPGARSMTLSPAGTLFVGSRDAGNVYAIPDADGDFRGDEVLVLARGLRSPNGVALRDGDLYVAEIHRILRFDDIEAALRDPPEPVVLAEVFPDEESHGWKFIAFGPDGLLYVPQGMPCNVCDPEDEIFGTIARFDVTGGEDGEVTRDDVEIVAHGLRNSVGFDWHPDTGELWFTDNGRDWFGDDLPPDELNHAPRPGLHFGFPYCHGRDLLDDEYGRGHSCADYTPPVQELGPHVAALGMRFYEGTQFPERYRGGIFIAEHGSWNRRVPIGYRVTFVPVTNGVAGGYEVFAEGWLQGTLASGRPVDVQELADGSLLVSDDKGDTIYRISYPGR
jgi:glucose/arabinose dehydrogenase